jgi:hypothetical protein
VAAPPFDMRDKTDATGIMLKTGIIQPLCLGQSVGYKVIGDLMIQVILQEYRFLSRANQDATTHKAESLPTKTSAITLDVPSQKLVIDTVRH